MKIPRRLNTALDWAVANARLVGIVLLLVIAAVAAMWLPVLAMFVVGAGFGGVGVHIRMTARLARLRAETDDLLRENGALRHERNVIAKGTAESGSILTQKLPSIPVEEDEE